VARELDGIRVLDLSQFLSGPRCSQALADRGADVVKVEPPGMGETMRLLCTLMRAEKIMSVLHRGKRGLALDIKNPEGKALLRRLADRADVVVDNFAPGTAERLGIDYETLKETNPRIVYVQISGFGETGPRAGRTAFDIVAQATGGVMFEQTGGESPPRIFWADLTSGAYAAMGAIAALFERERTGRGKLVDLAMQDVAYFHNFTAMATRAHGSDDEETIRWLGRGLAELLTDHNRPVPFWRSYPATDGHVVVVALTDRQWNSLLETIGREDLIGDERFAAFPGRVINAAAGVAELDPWFEQHTVAEVVETLSAKGLPCAPVLDRDAVNQDEQLLARKMLTEVEDATGESIAVVGDPLSGGQGLPDHYRACPGLGEHTAQVLGDWLDLSSDDIAALHDKGAVA